MPASTSTMAGPPLTFSDLITMTPVTSHTYSTHLADDFCVGSVPNGGYITSTFQVAAKTHMAHTHPTLSCPDVMNVHLQFLRRTATGPATFTVQDIKLGRRVSNLHLTLSQHKDAHDPSSPLIPEVQGYITLTNFARETGPTFDTRYQLSPPPLRADLASLAHTGEDANYTRRRRDPYWHFRRAARHEQQHLVKPARRTQEHLPRAVIDQWVRLRPLLPPAWTPTPAPASDLDDSGITVSSADATLVEHPGRWTNESLGYLVDIFPQVNEQFLHPDIEDAVLLPRETVSDAQILDMRTQKVGAEDPKSDSNSKSNVPRRTNWYPTLNLNLDVKKALPDEGVEWLFVRVQAKKIANGRFDLNVEVLDEAGEVVALSTHAALILDASRNITRNGNKAKKQQGKAETRKSKI